MPCLQPARLLAASPSCALASPPAFRHAPHRSTRTRTCTHAHASWQAASWVAATRLSPADRAARGTTRRRAPARRSTPFATRRMGWSAAGSAGAAMCVCIVHCVVHYIRMHCIMQNACAPCMLHERGVSATCLETTPPRLPRALRHDAASRKAKSCACPRIPASHSISLIPASSPTPAPASAAPPAHPRPLHASTSRCAICDAHAHVTCATHMCYYAFAMCSPRRTTASSGCSLTLESGATSTCYTCGATTRQRRRQRGRAPRPAPWRLSRCRSPTPTAAG